MDEKLCKVLKLFFSPEDFTQKPTDFLALLQRRYYQKAKRFHPDKGYPDPNIFLKLKESYLWLKLYYQKNPEAIFAFFGSKKDFPRAIFRDYVLIIRAFNRALDEYFSQRKSEKKEAYLILIEKLTPLEENLKEILSKAGGTIWEKDIKNHLKRMELWLKEARSFNPKIS